MIDDRVLEVAVALARGSLGSPPRGLCNACVDLLGVSAIGISLMTRTTSDVLCASDRRADDLDSLQFTLGEGPAADAYGTGLPIAGPDLADPVRSRWPNFSPSALETGTRGVFVFPLRAGPSSIGVLSLYQDRAGPLSGDQTARGLVVSEVVSRAVLSSDDVLGLGAGASPGEVSAHRAEVHQAAGMIAVRLGIPIGDAALRLRAHAFGEGRAIEDVAADVVARRLVLDDDRGRDTTG